MDLPSPRFGDRRLFPHLKARAYLNHAAVSAPSAAVEQAITATLQAYRDEGFGAVMPHLEQRERLRTTLGRLVGASSDEIGFVANTTTGVIDIAHSFAWTPGDRIIVFRGEFPANVTPWQRAAERFGLELVFVELEGFFGPGSGPGLEDLERELRAGAAMVAVSAVQFQTGLPMPLAQIGALTRQHGAALFVDAIQACGVAPIDVGTMGIDFLTCGGHKWLMGVEGSAFVYVRHERARQLRPDLAGWLSHEDPVAFLTRGAGHLRYDRGFRANASQFEVGALNALGFAGLEASVDLLLELGIEAIHDHVRAYLDLLRPSLHERGWTLALHRDRSVGSGILSARPPAGLEVTALAEALRNQGIAVSTPDGWLRFAPHWPNDPVTEIPMILGAIDGATE